MRSRADATSPTSAHRPPYQVRLDVLPPTRHYLSSYGLHELSQTQWRIQALDDDDPVKRIMHKRQSGTVQLRLWLAFKSLVPAFVRETEQPAVLKGRLVFHAASFLDPALTRSRSRGRWIGPS